jgi:hypothetical protein
MHATCESENDTGSCFDVNNFAMAGNIGAL